jgi:uncharacterized protein YkwD
VPTPLAAPLRRTALVRCVRIAVLQVVTLAVLTTSLGAPAAAGGYSQPEIDAAESAVIAGVNVTRAGAGLRPLHMDERVRDVARVRSDSMAREDYFAHRAPDGTDAGDLLEVAQVQVFAWGEAIGWNSRSSLEEGVASMLAWWRNSAAHRGLMVSTKYNYLGVGIVQDGRKLIYTIVFTRGPDRTSPWTRLLGAAGEPEAARGTAATASVTVSWKGRDVPLATLTAGLRDFRLQHRLAGGSWVAATRWTTERSVTLALESGEHHFRLRARDRARNKSPWTEPLAVVVP